jgi:hypothetical protein
LEGVPAEILRQIQGILQQVVLMREAFGIDYESFVGPAKSMIERLGADRKLVTKHFRRMIGQEQGVPNSRFLYYLPTNYLKNLESLIDLYLSSHFPSQSYASVPSPVLRTSADRLVFDH